MVSIQHIQILWFFSDRRDQLLIVVLCDDRVKSIEDDDGIGKWGRNGGEWEEDRHVNAEEE